MDLSNTLRPFYFLILSRYRTIQIALIKRIDAAGLLSLSLINSVLLV